MTEPRDPCHTDDHPLSSMPAERQLSVLRALVDTSLDAIIVHQPDGKVVFFSEGLCRLMGLTSQEMDGLNPFGWVSRESLRGAPERLEAILHEGRHTFRSTILRHDGATVPTEVFAKRIDTELGPLVVATIRDMSEQINAEERLRYLAYHDALTGLASRVAFTERLTTAIAEARRHGDIIMLAYIDLDRFKPVNDRWGHSVGDEVLTEMGRRIEACVRGQDMVARIGGDEFVVLLSRPASEDELPIIAERLLASIRQPIFLGGVETMIDASIGFSIFDAETDDERSLVVKADVAMYAAKEDPSHPWLVYDPSMR